MNILPLSGPFGAHFAAPLPVMTGPRAEKIIRKYQAFFQQLVDSAQGDRITYLPEREGPVEEWIDLESGDVPSNYIPVTLADAKELDDALSSIILISKPTTGKGFVTLAHEGAHPVIGSFLNNFDLLRETNAILSHWEDYKRMVAPKTPWGSIIAITLGAGVVVAGGYWYRKRYG